MVFLLEYKGEHFIATHRKLGFGLCAPNEELAQLALSQEMVNKLRKLTQVADKMIQPIVDEQITRCNYTVIYRYSEFYCRYTLFKGKAKEAYQTPPHHQKYFTMKMEKRLGGHTNIVNKRGRDFIIHRRCLMLILVI